ncbi:MAG TPA: hypothetical protein VEB40_01945, partial [Flavipsychrobacter sp.]|nr:hypothetical protein [Flavipsychrobacter sp.]
MLRQSSMMAAVAACLFATTTFAQEGSDSQTPMAYIEPAPKTFEHQVGVQANELIRQVFNFNNNGSSALNNPYLFTYSLNWKKPGIGIRLGVGPDFRSFKEDNGVVQQENNINVLNARFGI